MKNVYTSWDLYYLADKMSEKIIECWKTPFDSPAVIFTDPKTEQWFKLHWLKNQATAKSVLMNLKTLRIQQFLFDLVTPDTSDFQNVQRLSVELLRDVIITKLTSQSAGKYYFETLDSAELSTYLKNSDAPSSINANHLYDFSQTIASLFLDYEDTRPDALEETLSLEPWQQKLYKDVIGENGIEIEGTKYLTLFQLLKQNKNLNGGKSVFNWKKDQPIFIFGFSGIGQIYRKILDDFSKDYPLEVFLQLADIPDKPQNQLLDKWGDFGHEQFGLWTKDSSLQKAGDSQVFTQTDTLLHRTQKAIAENKAFAREPYDEDDTSITLTGAPTRLREIEALHSKICRLLTQNKDTQFGDILVVAPDMQNYKTAIEQVFDQTDQYSVNSDFPYIPYIIADFSGERSLTSEALTVLFGILKKGYLCRSDMFALLHNYLVQTVRDISEQEISDWADWAAKLNIYRDREGHEEWQKAKERLLLARLTDDLINDEILPFETMSTADDTSLFKFIKAVDELIEWSSYSRKNQFDANDIERLGELLKNWLLISGEIPKGLRNESLVFQNVVEEIERQSLSLTTAPFVYADCFSNALFDRSAAVALHSANIMAHGITFVNFESNRILPAKYIFFIGLDSKVFPGIDSENELDLRSKSKRQAGDESIPSRNKNAFLCQLMSARQGLFFSYVNKNLQKDEDYFKSSVLGDLFQTLYGEKAEYEKQIKIDEDRSWQELFTPREFRNKKNFIALQKSGGENNKKSKYNKICNPGSKDTPLTPPDRITISQMKKFLEDPFVFMVNQKLTNNYDDEENEQLEFEPLCLPAKLSSDLRKKYVQAKLKDETPDSEETNLKNQNALPDTFFGEKAIRTVSDNSEKLFNAVKDKEEFKNLKSSDFEFNENKPLQVKQYPDIPDKDWYISGDRAWYIKKEKRIITLELSNTENILTGYITSLLLLAEEDKNETYSVSLYVGSLDTEDNIVKGSIKEETYTATPEQARKVLSDIYKNMFIEPYQNCVPVNLVYKDLLSPKSKNKLDFKGFKSALDNGYGNGEWMYFSKRKLFDPDTDLGYTDENFKEKWKEARNQMAKLLLYIGQHADLENEAGE